MNAEWSALLAFQWSIFCPIHTQRPKGVFCHAFISPSPLLPNAASICIIHHIYLSLPLTIHPLTMRAPHI